MHGFNFVFTSRSATLLRPRKLPCTQLYSYVLTDEWPMDYALKHQVGDSHNWNDAVAKALRRVVRLVGLSRIFTVKWDDDPPICQTLALAVGLKKRTGRGEDSSEGSYR